MTQKLKLLLGLLVICAACSKEKETATGLKFTVLRAGDGVKLDSGKFLALNIVFKDGKDSVYLDTKKTGIQQIIQTQFPVPPNDGVIQAIMMMTKGDSITFKINAKELFTKTFGAPQLPPGVDSASMFTWNIGLASVLNSEDYQKLQSEIVAKQNEAYLKKQKEQLTIDTDIIDKHLQEKGIVAEKTESGIRYVVTKPGKGETVMSGQSATMAYSGYLLNGTPFDSGTYTFVVDGQQVIAGWDIAAKLMNKGSKITVFIPSTLAYGPQRRSEEIVENSILAFDMELVDIK